MPPKAARGRPATRRQVVNVDSGSTTPNVSDAADFTGEPQAPPPIDPQLQARDASSAPRSTPGPRGQVQRLQSLKKRGPTGSLIPPNPDGSTPKPTLKYQPRAVVRRSKEERDAREKLEAERQQERNAEVAAMRRTPGSRRGDRGRGGRGRGGGVSHGGMEVSGPLGSGTPGPGRGGSYGVRTKREKGRSSHRKSAPGGVAKTEGEANEVDYITTNFSSDEGGDAGPKYSIEQINIISDSEDEEFVVGKGKALAKKLNGANRGLRPVRVERHVHVERSVGVNTEASSNKSAELRKKAKEKEADKGEESLFVQDEEEDGHDADVEMTDATVVAARAAAAEADEEVRIKEEPTDGDVTMADNIPHTTDARVPPAAPRSPTRTRKKAAVKDPRSILQTEEERQEYDRHVYDVEQLKIELGTITASDGAATTEGEGGEAKPEAAKDERHGKLFLIQFPPMTPNLTLPKAPQADDNEDAIQEIPPPEATGSQPPVPGTPAQTPTIKKETGDPAASVDTAQQISDNKVVPPLITATNNNLPPGRVGKLLIHRSGRATIDWGGIPLELTRGSDVDFLQDAIVASEQKPVSSGAERNIWAMSQVSGKFVVTPDWEKLLG